MAELGYHPDSPSIDAETLGTYLVAGQKITADSDYTVDSITAYIMNNGTTYKLKFGIYTDVTGTPTSLVANSEIEVTVTNSDRSYQTGTYSGTKPTLSNGSVYWLCWTTEVADHPRMGFDSATNTTLYATRTSYAFPSTFPSNTNLGGTYKWIMYVTVTASAATSYTFTGPASGDVNAASTNFTITPNGTFTGTITPATDGTGTFNPDHLDWTAESGAKTCTYTPTSTAGSPHTLSVTDDGSLTDPAAIDYTVNSVALSTGVLSVASVATTVVNLSVAVATGGTSPYNYQFHCGTTANFSPVTGTKIGTNTTTRTYQHTGRTNGTTYFYKCVATDNNSATVTSNMVPAVPAASQGWLFMSDSFGDYVWNGNNYGADDFAIGQQFQAAMDACESGNAVKHAVSNQSTPAASTDDFVATLLAAAITAAPAATYPYAVIMLGLNDSAEAESKAQYKSNIQSMVDTLQTNSYTKIFLCYPPLIYWGTISTETQQAILADYAAAIDEVAAGETSVYAIKSLYGYTMNHTGDFGIAQDDIHPLQKGGAHMAMLLAKEIYGVLHPAGTGGVFMPTARQMGM